MIRPSLRVGVLAGVILLATITVTPAQTGNDRAVVLENAPILLLPEPNRGPLRVAAPGTVLTLLKEETGWCQVEFQDPEFGIRTGWVQSKFVRVERAALRPQDLSVTPTRPPARPA